ncbi:MAG TPA: GntR family transcriptional regulator [Stellaceae bacterium]|jgi:DNA-binding GntR family transcriptional regulator|nr:GntR family transcriptional regulator [Stellaceae bacterium]
MPQKPSNLLTEQVYASLKDDICDFRLLPGDRCTEGQLAERYEVSRTPVREALYRLKREGFVEVASRSGWTILPFDFARFDELYDLRTILETAAIERIYHTGNAAALADLRTVWSVPVPAREANPRLMADLDEEFHCRLVAAAGNAELARVHTDLTAKIRIIRRLDFVKPKRIGATYDQHASILRLILRGRTEEALIMLRAHIAESKQEVHKITIHMLHEARASTQARMAS